MKEGKFAKALDLTVVKAGKKVINATRPELIVVPTINRFSLNSLATDAMRLESGDFITLLVNRGAESFDEKFFITKGFGDDKATLASVGKAKGYGRVLTFNYSGIYSQMLQGTIEASELSPEGLVDLGLAVKREKEEGATFSANRKVHFEIQSIGVQVIGKDDDGDDIEQEVYMLTNSKIEDYDPRTMSDDTDVPTE